ncbi:hypothetical protein HDU97_008986 [Phlyctochytrium planicorne]|nr:hypothetical protein HDU97_008986 [Phlyctochytrium planicorne]
MDQPEQEWSPESLKVIDEWDDEPWDIEVKMLDAIKGYLTSSTSAEVAAIAIDNLFTLHRPNVPGEKKEDAVGFLLTLWERFSKTAQDIPFGHPCLDGLLELVGALHDVESISKEEIVLGNWGSYRMWSSLPLFGPAMHDYVNAFDHNKKDASTRWRKLHIYLARLTSNPRIHLDLSIHSIYMFADILEGKIRHIPNQPPIVSFKGLEKNVWGLEIWLQHAGRKWFRDQDMLKCVPHGLYWEQRKGEWSGEDRWALWKERLGLLMVDQVVSEETRAIAKRCLELMDLAEAP